MKVAPRIMLETISPFCMNLIMFLLYSALGIGIGLTFYNGTFSFQLNANICSQTNQIYPCTELNELGYNNSWSSMIVLSPLEQGFGMSLRLDGPAADITYQTTVFVRINCQNDGLSNHEEILFDKTVIVKCFKNECEDLMLFLEEDYIFFQQYSHSQFNVTISFIENPILTSGVSNSYYIVSHHRYQYQLVHVIFRAVFTPCTLILLLAWLLMLYRSTKQKQKTEIVQYERSVAMSYLTHEKLSAKKSRCKNEVVDISPADAVSADVGEVAIILSEDVEPDAINNQSENTVSENDIIKNNGITNENQVNACEEIKNHIPNRYPIAPIAPELSLDTAYKIDQLIKNEQNWITLLLFALLIFQNPSFVPQMLLQYRYVRILSAFFYIMSVGLFILFWLNFISLLGNSDSTEILNEKDLSVCSNFVNIVERTIGWKIKLLHFFLFEIFAFIPIAFYVNSSSDSSQSSLRSFNNIALWIVITLLFVWLPYFLLLLYKTNLSLKSTPYLLSRHRQLAFRMFLLMINLLVLYAVAFCVYSFLNSPNIATYYVGIPSLPSFIFISVNVYLTAYIYIPVSSVESKEETLRNQVTHKMVHPLLSLISSCSVENIIPVITSEIAMSLRTAKVLCRMSWEAYFPDINVEQFGYKLVDVIFDIPSDTSCFIATRKNAICLCFRGTQSLNNILTDVNITRTEFNPYDDASMNPLVHTGFLCAYLSVQKKIIDTIARLLGAKAHVSDHEITPELVRKNTISMTGNINSNIELLNQGLQRVMSALPFYESNEEQLKQVFNEKFVSNFAPPEIFESVESIADDLELPSNLISGKKIYLTGHSLGGALASLCAFDLRSKFRELDENSIESYTFGSPRVGNIGFSLAYNRKIPCTYRFVNNDDIVPSIPQVLFLYRHVGIEISCDEFGNVVENPSFVERSLKRGVSVADHSLTKYCAGLDIAAQQKTNLILQRNR